jgi:hypothetical protein
MIAGNLDFSADATPKFASRLIAHDLTRFILDFNIVLFEILSNK